MKNFSTFLLLSCIIPALCFAPVKYGFSKEKEGEYVMDNLKDTKDRPYKIKMEIKDGKADFKVIPGEVDGKPGEVDDDLGKIEDGYFYPLGLKDKSHKVPVDGWTFYEGEYNNLPDEQKSAPAAAARDGPEVTPTLDAAGKPDPPKQKKQKKSFLRRAWIGFKNFFRRCFSLSPKDF